jgi:hypothetical protein
MLSIGLRKAFNARTARSSATYIQSQLCYEYSPIRAQRDNPELLDVVCFSGNLGRPLQHACCTDCILFNTDNDPRFNNKHVLYRVRVPITA